MKLTPMRFGDYVWPHNPRVYEITFKRDLVCHRVPFGLYTLQSTGRQNRIMRGEGEFAGEGAYEQFKKLACVFYSAKPGVLVHPLWDSTTAYFVSLQVMQEPTEDYVRYSFEFWECCDLYAQTLTELEGDTGEAEKGTEQEKEHTVQPGENLWSISRDVGISVEQLMEMNKEIKNPLMLPTGFRVIMHE